MRNAREEPGSCIRGPHPESISRDQSDATGPGGIAFKLETQLCPELQVTRVERATRLSKARVPNAVMQLTLSTRQLEVRMIQDVEAFRSELELRSLRDLKV